MRENRRGVWDFFNAPLPRVGNAHHAYVDFVQVEWIRLRQTNDDDIRDIAVHSRAHGTQAGEVVYIELLEYLRFQSAVPLPLSSRRMALRTPSSDQSWKRGAILCSSSMRVSVKGSGSSLKFLRVLRHEHVGQRLADCIGDAFFINILAGVAVILCPNRMAQLR